MQAKKSISLGFVVDYFNIQLLGVKKMIYNTKIKLESVICPKSHNGLFKIANYLF
jgi:hypothetical protein